MAKKYVIKLEKEIEDNEYPSEFILNLIEVMLGHFDQGFLLSSSIEEIKEVNHERSSEV